MSESKPWEFHPDLTADRLVSVAEILADARRDALERFEDEPDRMRWSVGCTAYEISMNRLYDAARDLPWLEILDPTRRFIFKVGAVPVRFYRGEADEPPARYLRQHVPEARQLSMAFEGDADQSLIWRFAVETDHDGDAIKVVFFGTTDGEKTRASWSYDVERAARPIPHPAIPGRGEGVALPPVQVWAPSTATDNDRDDEDGAG